MSEHTPTPWTVYDATDPLHIKIKGVRPDIGGAHVADILSPENADFLLKAVNNHDALVKALRELVDYGGTVHGWDDARKYARQILASVQASGLSDDRSAVDAGDAGSVNQRISP